MKLRTYLATIKHDSGKAKLKVVSMSGRKGAVTQVTAFENCDENAILKLKLIDSKNIE